MNPEHAVTQAALGARPCRIFSRMARQLGPWLSGFGRCVEHINIRGYICPLQVNTIGECVVVGLRLGGTEKRQRSNQELRWISEPPKTWHMRSAADAGGLSMTTDFVVNVLADGDGDGLPDVFEQAYGLDPNDSTDGSLDSDGDGFTNLEEYLAGTCPFDPASSMGIRDTFESGPDIYQTFNTRPTLH